MTARDDQQQSRFARTDPFLDELDRIGYIAIPKSELAELDRLRVELADARTVIRAVHALSPSWDGWTDMEWTTDQRAAVRAALTDQPEAPKRCTARWHDDHEEHVCQMIRGHGGLHGTPEAIYPVKWDDRTTGATPDSAVSGG